MNASFIVLTYCQIAFENNEKFCSEKNNNSKPESEVDV